LNKYNDAKFTRNMYSIHKKTFPTQPQNYNFGFPAFEPPKHLIGMLMTRNKQRLNADDEDN